jgi:hypothetical protein
MLFPGSLCVSPRPSSPGDCAVIWKYGFPENGRGGRGCWAACREAACQRINETLPEDSEWQPLTVWIQDRQPYEDIRF